MFLRGVAGFNSRCAEFIEYEKIIDKKGKNYILKNSQLYFRTLSCGGKSIKKGRLSLVGKGVRGFSLIELLVVISIISLLMGILMPVLGRVRAQALVVAGVGNQRQIVNAVNSFATDNEEAYPESVATIGTAEHWNWQEPMMLTGHIKRSPRHYRAISSYLGEYIQNAEVMFCPSAPKKYKYLRRAWEAGEEWDNPETAPKIDPVTGTYCLYWNYTGFLAETGKVFNGPVDPSGGKGQSRLLVSDYFGYDHWRNRGSYGSCERFGNFEITTETWVSSAFCSSMKKDANDVPSAIDIKLNAGYVDGHVESYTGADVVTMRVSLSNDGKKPYPTGVGAGDIYLPENGLAGK